MAIAPSYARDEVTRDANVLPEQAKNILKTHFPKIHINHIKVDKHTFGGDDYDVVLNDGTELDFDNKGNLKEIDCGASAVPATLILKPIRDYVANNFSGQKIVTLDINSNYYDIELSNGVDLVFDRAGNFKKIDDWHACGCRCFTEKGNRITNKNASAIRVCPWRMLFFRFINLKITK